MGQNLWLDKNTFKTMARGERNMFNYLIEFVSQEKLKYQTNGCGLIVTGSPPSVSYLDSLPIATDSAYIRSADQLYYVCKSRSECTRIDITSDAIKIFDKEIRPDAKFRRLNANELAKIALFTDHSPINPQPYELLAKHYQTYQSEIPNTPADRVNYFMGYAIIGIAGVTPTPTNQLIINGQDHDHTIKAKYIWTALMLLGSILPHRFDHRSISNWGDGWKEFEQEIKHEMGYFSRFSSTSLYETEFKKHLNKDQIKYYLTSFIDEVKRKKDLLEANLMSGALTAAGETTAYLSGHSHVIDSLAVLGDGRLVSGSSDKTIKLWDLKTGKRVTIPTGNYISAIADLGDGRLASSVSFEGSRAIKIWDLETRNCLMTLSCTDTGPLAVLKDGRLASASRELIQLWNLKTKGWSTTSSSHAGKVLCLAVLGDGRLVSGSADNTIKLWDVSTGKCVSTLTGHTLGISALALLADGRLASGSEDKTIKIWDIKTGRCVTSLNVDEEISSLVFLENGRLASGSKYSRDIKLWDITSGKCVSTLSGHTSVVYSLAVLKDGRLVSGSADTTIKLWGSPKPEARLIQPPTVPPAAISAKEASAAVSVSIAFQPGGSGGAASMPAPRPSASAALPAAPDSKLAANGGAGSKQAPQPAASVVLPSAPDLKLVANGGAGSKQAPQPTASIALPSAPDLKLVANGGAGSKQAPQPPASIALPSAPDLKLVANGGAGSKQAPQPTVSTAFSSAPDSKLVNSKDSALVPPPQSIANMGLPSPAVGPAAHYIQPVPTAPLASNLATTAAASMAAAAVTPSISREEFQEYVRTLVPREAVSEAVLRNPADRLRRLQEAYIHKDPHLLEYYRTLKNFLYETFLATLTIKSGMVENAKITNQQAYVSYATSALEHVVEGIPILSQFTKGVGAIANQLISVDQSNKVTRLIALLPDPEQLGIVVGIAARQLTIGLETDIKAFTEQTASLKKSFMDWAKKLKGKFILDDIDTPYKAKGLEHATAIIILGMAGKLNPEALVSLDLILLVKPEFNLVEAIGRLKHVADEKMQEDKVHVIELEQPHMNPPTSGAKGGSGTSSPPATSEELTMLRKELEALKAARAQDESERRALERKVR
ncbi:MAG: hypothetical protein K0R66_1201, partial [Gammaproteobacteria bacterium]|nr:hypothetical protein [Gammaproteobacteria bacterium]